MKYLLIFSLFRSFWGSDCKIESDSFAEADCQLNIDENIPGAAGADVSAGGARRSVGAGARTDIDASFGDDLTCGGSELITESVCTDSSKGFC